MRTPINTGNVERDNLLNIIQEWFLLMSDDGWVDTGDCEKLLKKLEAAQKK